MTQKLIVSDELKNLLPPLSGEELGGLEESILKDGCLSPLFVWDGMLVDGHHRYAICTKHNIHFDITQIPLADMNEAKLWVWKHQENRRNLTPYQRAEIALKLKEPVAAKAKERQRGGQGGVLLLENSPKANDTRKELSEIAGVSDNTIAKAEYIAQHADEATKEKLRRGEKGTSINNEYKKLKEQKQDANSRKKVETTPEVVDDPDVATIRRAKNTRLHYECPVNFETEPDDTTFEWLSNDERKDFEEMKKDPLFHGKPPIRQYTLQHVPNHAPATLIRCLFDLFSPYYRRRFLIELARQMFAEDDANQTRELIEQLANEFQD